MPSRTPQDLEPEDNSGLQRRRDKAPAEPSRASPVTRIQILTGRHLARHPALLTVLEGRGCNNPGGSMNP
jgi:hypothetical protein